MIINILGARNPVWADSDHTSIELEVNFEHLGEWVAFHATPHDTLEHGPLLFENAKAGMYGTIGEFVRHE